VKLLRKTLFAILLSTVSVFHIPNTANATLVSSGLVLNLDASVSGSYNGTTWFDQSPSGFNATQVNNPTYNSSDRSFTLNGTNQYFNLGNRLNFTSAFSIEVTFSPNSVSGSPALVARQNTAVAGNYFLGISNSKANYYVESTPWGINSSSTLVVGTKYTSTLVYDASRAITPYLDGVQNGTKTTFPDSLWSTNINLQIGAALNRSSPSDFFNGKIYSVRIYNRSLSSSEVQQNYNLQAPDTTAPTFTSSTSFSAAENIAISANAATIKVSESATVTISAGADAALFNIITSDSVTAFIRFKVSPNFEAPADVGGNNIHEITLTATDTAANTGTQSITITVSDVVDTSSFNSLALAGSATSATYRTVVVITANVTVASKVTFRVNGKILPGCKNKSTTGSSPNIVATCSWKPSIRGNVSLTAGAVPTGAGISSATANPVSIRVGNRTGPRA
jgi:hypothetical protein